MMPTSICAGLVFLPRGSLERQLLAPENARSRRANLASGDSRPRLSDCAVLFSRFNTRLRRAVFSSEEREKEKNKKREKKRVEKKTFAHLRDQPSVWEARRSLSL
jgi:hypothetical protein